MICKHTKRWLPVIFVFFCFTTAAQISTKIELKDFSLSQGEQKKYIARKIVEANNIHVTNGSGIEIFASRSIKLKHCSIRAGSKLRTKIISANELPAYDDDAGLCFTFSGCTSIKEQVNQQKKQGTNYSLTGDRGAFWQRGQTIRVKFLDGNTKVIERVKKYPSVWSKYANIKFQFVDSGYAEIRISFKYEGSYTKGIGVQMKKEPDNQHNMNFGWFDEDSTEEEIRRTTLHEFGHALGFPHEHHNPAANIRFDEDPLIRYYIHGYLKREKAENIIEEIDVLSEKYPNLVIEEIVKKIKNNDWRIAIQKEIESKKWNVTRQLKNEDDSEFISSDFDPKSIMCYPIPSRFIYTSRFFYGSSDEYHYVYETTGDVNIGYNTKLSYIDKVYANMFYPFEPGEGPIVSSEYQPIYGNNPCSRCDGSGTEPAFSFVPMACQDCNGTGKEIIEWK